MLRRQNWEECAVNADDNEDVTTIVANSFALFCQQGLECCNMQADYKALMRNCSGTSHDILTMTSEMTTVAPAWQSGPNHKGRFRKKKTQRTEGLSWEQFMGILLRIINKVAKWAAWFSYYENRPFSLSRLSYSLDVQVKNTLFIKMNFLCRSITFASRSLIRNRRRIKMREEVSMSFQRPQSPCLSYYLPETSTWKHRHTVYN